MSSLDIVDLIENNPITKLSTTYNNKLITKIKDNFTETQQQLFVSSFYCYLNCNQKTDFIIDLDNIWKWLGFSQKIRAKELLEKNFKLDIDYKNKSLLSVQGEQKKGKGGHNKEIIMLSIKTFKSLCLKAGTKKADEIHEYYIKLEDLIQEVLEEEAIEMKNKLLIKQNELEQLEEKKRKEYEEKLIKEKALERQKILLKEFGNSESLIYIIKVKSYNNGEYIVKIGESRRGIIGRFNEHKSNYEECLLLDCFLVDKSTDFETFLHNHENIRLNRVTNLDKHKNERELFLIGKELSYKMLLKIIDNNIKYFEKNNNDEVEKLKLECEKLTLLNEFNKNGNINLFIEQLINNNNANNELLLNKIDNLEKMNKIILEKLNIQQIKNTTNFNQPLVTLGPRLQQINPETLTLVKVYDSVSECMRENYQIKRPSINKAIAENTIYNGYRWMYVDRELDPNVIINIQHTKKTKVQNLGYIAKLDKNKSEIINVYLDRKTASIANNFTSSSALDNPVKNGSLINDNYYILYNDVCYKLKTNFLSKHNNEEILLYKNGIGQYNREDKLIQEFICKYDCIKKLHMSDKTLTKALEKNIAYNNNFFKYLGSKLQIIN
tara:strand:+ start:2224 stop:4047 length:1824 start_codon:yes stop_codon:yes gene_type:complete